MKVKNEGICRFCYETFSGRGIARHLKSCKAKEEKDKTEAGKSKKQEDIYMIKLSSYGPFWLYIEMKGSATLWDLDSFIRRIWVECCGHLSEFTIQGKKYSDTEDAGWFKDEVESVDNEIETIMKKETKFEYIYDFGSSTYIEGKVLDIRKGAMKEDIRIVARNEIPEIPCSSCGKPAEYICWEDNEPYCAECLEEEGYDEEETLPIVNSPRMGVCGYAGDEGFDDFQPPKK